MCIREIEYGREREREREIERDREREIWGDDI